MDVFYIKLTNGDDITARMVSVEDDHYVVEWPMLVEVKSPGGDDAINLSKYLTFTNDQTVALNKNHVVAIKEVTTAFETYYYNNIEYHETLIQPNTDYNLKITNENMAATLSEDNKEFTNLIKKHAKRISSLSGLVH